MSLASLFSRPVAVAIGGTTVLASELRLRDLAALESVVAELCPDPLADLDPAAADYPERLKALYDGTWPPPIGSAEADAVLLGSDGGRAAFVLTVCRLQADMNAERALELARADDPPGWSELTRIAFALPRRDLWAEVVRLIDAHLGIEPFAAAPELPEASDEPITWPEAVAETCEAYGLTIDQVGDLTLGQWRALRSGGKAPVRSEPVPADPELAESVAKARWAFWWDKPPAMPAPHNEDTSAHPD